MEQDFETMRSPNRHIAERRHIAEGLIPALEKLRAAALSLELDYREQVDCVDPRHQASASNLMHYLALRQSDIRDLQQELALLGLSRLGRAEAHALGSLDAVLEALRALAGLPGGEAGPVLDIGIGEACLNAHAVALLGHPSDKHATRIMVTMPSEAATDAKLVHDLLAAGMDIMRINCAHDGPDAWLAMIRNLRAAEAELGRGCRVYADLAGPKLRTGAIGAAGRLAEFKVKRDVRGMVTAPSRIWVTPERHREEPALPVDGVLPVDDILLRAVRAGDLVEIDDTRGSTRALIARERYGASWLMHCRQHAFFADGAGCKLYRNDNLLVQGRVGKLPEVFQPILLKAGEELVLTREQEPGALAQYDERGGLLGWSSAGTLGFKGTRKATPFAAARVAEAVAEKAKKIGLEEVIVLVKGVGSGRGHRGAGTVEIRRPGPAVQPRRAAGRTLPVRRAVLPRSREAYALPQRRRADALDHAHAKRGKHPGAAHGPSGGRALVAAHCARARAQG